MMSLKKVATTAIKIDVLIRRKKKKKNKKTETTEEEKTTRIPALKKTKTQILRA